MTTTSGAVPGILEDQLRPLPAEIRRGRRHRRPTGEAPPLPRHLEATGVWWLVAAIALIALSLLVFNVGRYGRGVSFTVVDTWMLERLAALGTPGLARLMLAVSALLGTFWTVKVLAWTTLVVLVVSKRFRHLLVGLVSVQVVTLATIGLSAAVRRPRPFGIAIEGSWAGWAMPSRPVAYLSAILVAMLYSLVPKGRWRQAGSGSPPGWSRCWRWPACTWGSTPPATCWSRRPSV